MDLSTIIWLLPFAWLGWIAYDGYRTLKKTRTRLKAEEERLRKKFEQTLKDQQRKQKLENEIVDVLRLVQTDWSRSKVKSKLTRAADKVTYRLDNGNLFEYQFKGTLFFSGTTHRITYSVGLTYQLVILKFIGTLVADIDAGLAKDGSDPKSRRYYVLLDNIKLRRESLAKMRPNDPERAALENELRVVEKKAAEMKKTLNYVN